MTENRSPMRRFGIVVSFLAVGGVAAYVSYRHIYEVALLAHQPQALAVALPLSVDGLLLIASLAMGEDKAANRHPRGWARSGFALGSAVSVAANLASTWVHYGPTPLPLAVAGWAPIALLWCVEIVSRPGKPRTSEAVPPVTELQVPTAAEMAELPAAPVSPAPATPGRPRTAVKRGPGGVVLRKEDELPVGERTSRRIRNEQPERLDG